MQVHTRKKDASATLQGAQKLEGRAAPDEPALLLERGLPVRLALFHVMGLALRAHPMHAVRLSGHRRHPRSQCSLASSSLCQLSHERIQLRPLRVSLQSAPVPRHETQA